MKFAIAVFTALMVLLMFTVTPASADHTSVHFRPDICVETDNGDACLEAKGGEVGILCAQVGPALCCKQVIVSSKSKGGKKCQDCENKCDGISDNEKRESCFNNCEQKNEGCNGGSSSKTLTEIGEMSCVLND